MKKISWFSFGIAALVVCLTGCMSHSVSSGETDFEVDGTKYGVYRFATIDKQNGGVVTSSLVVFPSACREGWYWHVDPCLMQGKTFLVIRRIDGGHPVAETDTLYFMREGRIVFEKSYQELGIDAQQLNADNEVALDYLQPILETMIREHVKPQAPAMEEPNHATP